jgi:hypothetical protein
MWFFVADVVLVVFSVPRRMHDQIRAALPHIAYFMRSGPWRALWIRYGYDPRATV